MEIKEYLKVFRRRYLLFAFVTVIIFGVQIFLTWHEMPRHRARARLLFDTTSPQEVMLTRLTGEAPSRYVGMGTRMALIRTLRVSEIASELLRGARPFPERPALSPEDRARHPFLRLSPENLKKLNQTYADLPPTEILSTLNVERNPETTIVDITSETTDPGVAADIANAITLALQIRTRELIVSRIHDSISSASGKIESAAKESEEAQAEFDRFREELGLETSVMGFSEQLRLLIQERDTLQARQTTLRAQKAALSETTGATGSGTFEPPLWIQAENSTLSLIRGQILATEVELANLRLRFTDEHYEVLMREARLTELRRREQEEVGRIGPRMAKRNEGVTAQIDVELRDLDRQIAGRTAEIARLQSQASRYQAGERKVEGARQKVVELQRMAEELKTREDLMPELVTVERWASPTDSEPLGKPGSQQIYFVIIATLMIATGLMFLVDMLDTTIRTDIDVRKYLNLPLLTSVPRIVDPARLLMQIPIRNPIVEIFGRLAALLLSHMDRQGGKTLLFTSVTLEEGKTTISTNVAIAMARLGRRVVLVDGDLRRPAVHRFLTIDNSTGLSTFLEGKIEARYVLGTIRGEAPPTTMSSGEGMQILPEESAPVTPAPGDLPSLEPGDLRAREAVGETDRAPSGSGIEETPSSPIPSIAVPSGLPNLWVVPSGPSPVNPVALLESARMETLLAALRNHFDIVIIDSPPIDGAADPLTLSARVDACVLITVAGSVQRHQATWAKRLLQDFEANLLGVVLNKCKMESKSYYYYYSKDPGKSLRSND